MVLHYCSARVRRLSKAIAESPYYNAFGTLVGLVLAGFGAWLAVLAWLDLGSEGALAAFGFGIFFGIFGLTFAGLWFRRLRRA